MEIREIYISDDGEEFDSEKECLEHEQRNRSLDCVVMFDSTAKLITGETLVNAFAKASFIYIVNAEKAEKYFDWLQDSYVSKVPECVNDGELYFYNETVEDYEEFNCYIDGLIETRDIIMKQVMSKNE